jgi:hypothetical protein
LALALAWSSRAACADSPDPSPSPVSTYVSIEEESSPDYDGESGSSNQFNLRAQTPFADGTWALRLKLPMVLSAPATSITGAGDLQLFALKVAPTALGGGWLAGATLKLPTSQNTSLGSGKFSIGPAGGYQVKSGAWTLGFFAQSFFSVAGTGARPGVAQSKMQPSATYAFGNGWSVGTSIMTFTYDWISDQWTDVPIGLRIGKRLGNPRAPLDLAFEGEKNLADARGAPGWTLRTSFRYTFPRP